MPKRISRHETTSRYGVTQHCRGRAVRLRSGTTCEYRGVDVSEHGLGCVIIGEVHMSESLLIELDGHSLTFEVMWVESHLGIENTYRVGLQCLDRLFDVRGRLMNLGLVTSPVDDGNVA